MYGAAPSELSAQGSSGGVAAWNAKPGHKEKVDMVRKMCTATNEQGKVVTFDPQPDCPAKELAVERYVPYLYDNGMFVTEAPQFTQDQADDPDDLGFPVNAVASPVIALLCKP